MRREKIFGLTVNSRKKLTQNRLRLCVVVVKHSRNYKRDSDHAKRQQRQNETGLDHSRLDPLLVARQSDRLNKQVSKGQKYEQRQIGKQKDGVPEAMEQG